MRFGILKKCAAWAGLAAGLLIMVLGAYYGYRTVRAREAFAPHWKRAEPASAPNAEEPLAGAWEGRWNSSGVGDSGELKAVLWRNALTNEWHAQFLADHYAIFQANEGIVIHPVRQSDGRWTFSGEAELREGRHEYAATCDGHRLEFTWSSALDHGTVTLEKCLRREEPSPAQAARSYKK